MLLDTLKVFLRIHAHGVMGRFLHGDVNAIFEKAELFQFLQLFQRRRGKLVKHFERRGAERVKALMFIVLDRP